MLCSEIVSYLNQIAPEDLACDWDNVGLLVGDMDREIRRIVIGLTLSDNLFNRALDEDADMIITHHPLFLNKINKFVYYGDSFESAMVYQLIKYDFCYYAAHTNLDVAMLNKILFDLFELENFDKNSFDYLDKDNSMGLVGRVKENISLQDFAKFIKEKLELDKINFYGDKECVINKVALCSGNGANSDYFWAAIDKSDVYLTGDIRYHDVMNYCVNEGLNLIDITHASEKIFAKRLKRELEKKIKNAKIKIICCEDIDKNFFHVT